MKVPISLSKGLKQEQIEQLERELKHSVLVKQLRKYIDKEIKCTYDTEELDSATMELLFRTVGVRRGLRQVLNLIPENKDD